MNLTRKIVQLILMLALLASVVVIGFVASREFAMARAQLIENSIARVHAEALLPMLLKLQDAARIETHLSTYLDSDAVRYVRLSDSMGELVLERSRSPGDTLPKPSHNQMRADSPPTEVSRLVRQLEQGLLAGIGLSATALTDISIPVLSPLNSLAEDYGWESFIASLDDRGSSRSQYVQGFISVGISHAHLWQQVKPIVMRTVYGCVLFVLLCAIFSWFYSRRITRPFTQLAEWAKQAARGELDKEVRVKGTGEARHIANLLNMVTREHREYRSSLDVNQKLLSMKVEERDTQLSERTSALNQAVEEVTRSREDLHKMAYFDSLTGLPNRRLFTEQLNLLLRMAKRNKTLLALLFLDLDNFKRINDTLGHSAGDLLLREVGIRLSNSMRDSDVLAHFKGSDGSVEVARLGGDEFTVVLNQIENPAAAGVVAQRLLDAMSEPLSIDGHEIVVTPSIGVAIGPQDAQDIEGLLKAADAAMYHAKSAGRNNYLFYSPEMDTSSVERLQLETDFRRAIRENELVMHYQPQVDVETGTLVGVEALIRWHHPERGLVPPGKFIAMAEEMGLIVHISEWALEQACLCIRNLQKVGLNLPRVSVNVSALAFSPSLVDRIDHALTMAGIDPGVLELELTEGVMMDSGCASLQSLERIKALGVSLAIDDFGTGYSSLSYLSHFPLDTLKIDRSFIVDFEKSSNNASLVKAIIAMAHSLNLNLVAEGVETQEQLNFVHENGVNVVQGFLFSKAVPEKELADMIKPGHFTHKTGRLPSSLGQQRSRGELRTSYQSNAVHREHANGEATVTAIN